MNEKKITLRHAIAAFRRLVGNIMLIAVCSLLTFAQTNDLTRWANPFIGTGGHGHTFPGAVMPFGMVQLSPDTRIDNWDGSSGYHYSDDVIYGFSHTHLSGTGIPDGCDILFMPTVSRTRFVEKLGDKKVGVFGSKFSHTNERAEPGYYSVRLDDDGIFAELTATDRVGLHRYTFPNSGPAKIQLNSTWRDKPLDIKVTRIDNRRIEGYRRSSSWAKDQTVYFVAEFSKPFRFNEYSKWLDNSVSVIPGSIKTIAYSTAFDFAVDAGEQIMLKVAISYVSIEGARKNLAAELPGWDFDKVRADAKAAWNKELSKIEVSGGTPDQTTTFYTALYHTMIHPSVFSDVDGQYLGHDGKVHQLRTADTPVRTQSQLRTADTPVRMSVASTRTSANMPKASNSARPRSKPLGGGTGDADKSVRGPGEQYTVFSLWDTFRAAHPLYTIIEQKRTVDFINTFIRQYEQGGRLPVWELWGEETDTMIGYHAVSVIADAMGKGIKGFDYEKAYAAAKHSAELDHFGLAAYRKRGYISMEDENESVSKTLEYAYNDWCIAQMAKTFLRREKMMRGLNDEKIARLEADYNKYLQRARYFENLYDPATGFMRPKKNGGWVSPFAPNEVTFNFTEGNSWVYSFFVPQDVSRLMQLYGGKDKFVEKLDELFTTTDKLAGREQPDITGLIGQYAHGNEPSHHIAYLFSYAHQPWKTQKYVRQIMDEFYKPTPDGLIGNEDCGQMSAWYILSASGFYPVDPGDGIYTFGTPLFPEMTYRLENGKTFTIRARNVSSTNKYILNARLNGAPYKKAFIRHEDIMRGGVLEFAMIDQPVATAFNDFPMSNIDIKTIAVPVIDGGAPVFQGKTTVTLSTITPNAKIYYTVNGRTLASGEWMLYEKPFEITETTDIKAVAVGDDATRSIIAEARFVAKPNDWTVKITSKYSRQYTGGGDEGLIDGLRGTINFASGEWQGYQGQDFEAVIDLQHPTKISEVGGGFLQVARSWIWMPTKVEFEVSDDGTNFRKVAAITTDIPPEDMTSIARDYVQKIDPVTARYVRVRAKSFGKIPAWHPGAGYDAYIFVDEIIIR
ncbi:MAG: GH92 family glycosyl hydrolase [Acidobacteria bacterium]|nr:GH92 family glycosyl hydrolase [Acidobacteriota bacterium]